MDWCQSRASSRRPAPTAVRGVLRRGAGSCATRASPHRSWSCSRSRPCRGAEAAAVRHRDHRVRGQTACPSSRALAWKRAEASAGATWSAPPPRGRDRPRPRRRATASTSAGAIAELSRHARRRAWPASGRISRRPETRSRRAGQIGGFEPRSTRSATPALPVPPRHMAATGGIFAGSAPAYEAVRPGLSLYGLLPRRPACRTASAPSRRPAAAGDGSSSAGRCASSVPTRRRRRLRRSLGGGR